MKILFFIILVAIIIATSLLIRKVISMARLKYQLRRGTIVIITSPGKEGTKATIAYPYGISSETRETVKKIIETAAKN